MGSRCVPEYNLSLPEIWSDHLCFLCQPNPKDERLKLPGLFVATGSRDKTIRLWDVTTAQCIRTLVRPIPLFLSSHMNERGGLTTTLVFLFVSNLVQSGHDNWLRALVFHPNGKFLLSASDDKTVRVWDLVSGRCTKTVEAHGHFVTCFSWGRALVSGGGADEGANGTGEKVERRVNVIATGSVDQTVKVRLPVSLVSIRLELIWITRRCGCPSGLGTMSPARLQRILRPVSFALRCHPPSFLLSTSSGSHHRHGITRKQRLLSLTFSSRPSCAPVALPFSFPSTVPLYLCPTASVSTLCHVLRPSLPLLAPRSGSAASGGAARAVLPVGRPTPVCPLPFSPRTATFFPFS